MSSRLFKIEKPYWEFFRVVEIHHGEIFFAKEIAKVGLATTHSVYISRTHLAGNLLLSLVP
jgi:hypothetical protein